MNNLLNENYLEELVQPIIDNLNYSNNYVIQVICKRLKKINSVHISQLKNSIEYAGADINLIEKEIAKITNKNIEEINTIFEEIAKNNIEFANTFYQYRGLKTLKTYKENKNLLKLVEAIKKQTIKDYKNISKTTGFKTNKIKSIREEYITVIDRGIVAVTTGTMDYNIAIKQVVEKMINSGIKYVDFESGYVRRMDSQVRMNILEGIRRLNMEMLDITSKDFQADGYEITAHSLCAPDHQYIQGQQYPKNEYEKLNANLKRPIGTLNCKHIAIPIILGVSEPTYSKKELEEIRNKSNEIVTYKDKSYTRYEASQRQRKLETKIRKEKERLQAFKTLDDKIEIKKSKEEINRLTKLYKDFSNSVGLSLYLEKTRI